MADISMSFFSQKMARHVTVKVILPFDIAPMWGFQEPFKTLYFLPGYSANAESIVSSTILAERVFARGFAVVIPDGENAFYTNQEDINAFYEDFVAEELVAVTRKLFPLSDKREDTYIGGISMGGFGSLMLGSRHMDTFSKIMALSPAAFPYRQNLLQSGGFTRQQLDRYFKSEDYYLDNYHPANNLKKAKKKGKVLPDIFLCCGEKDPLTYEMDCEFAREMEKEGIPVTVQWGEGTHDTLYWNTLLPTAIDFMLKE